MIQTPLEAVRGDTLEVSAAIAAADGNPFLLTNCTVFFTIKDLYRTDTGDDSSAVAKCSWVAGGSSSGMTVATPSSGIVNITVEPSVMAALDSARPYAYDLQVVYNAGATVKTVARGKLQIVADITRRTSAP